ncbi:aurora kinase A-interacting protein isoform X2 [Coturnix japonica]|uniref:aurora kinase A-interacting protein isoform X2 n=1 Tax=Coturnix japonica TaxID=93934 RepID=UPI0013A5F0BE|nr:aurora kinase A-interacting protein isoform X2 [Coturnix japonica]
MGVQHPSFRCIRTSPTAPTRLFRRLPLGGAVLEDTARGRCAGGHRQGALCWRAAEVGEEAGWDVVPGSVGLNEVEMLLSQLTARLLKASRVAGHFLPRSVSSFLCCHSTSVNYCTQPPNKNGAQPQQWHTLEPELEEMLVPRKLSISPLESWLTVRYSLPKAEVSNAQEEEVGSGLLQRYDCPPCDVGADVEEGEGTPSNTVQCKNVLKIRRRKMNRHKYKKLLKRRKFVRRRIKEGRKKKRQAKFEKDLERIWKRAGLKGPPAGWQTPKIFLKSSKR